MTHPPIRSGRRCARGRTWAVGAVAVVAVAVTAATAPGPGVTTALWRSAVTIPFPSTGVTAPSIDIDDRPGTGSTLVDGVFKLPSNSHQRVHHRIDYSNLSQTLRFDFEPDQGWLEAFHDAGMAEYLHFTGSDGTRPSGTGNTQHTGTGQQLGWTPGPAPGEPGTWSIYVVPRSLAASAAAYGVPPGAATLVVDDGNGFFWFTFGLHRQGAPGGGFVMDPSRLYLSVRQVDGTPISEGYVWIPPMAHPSFTDLRWDHADPMQWVRPDGATSGFVNPLFSQPASDQDPDHGPAAVPEPPALDGDAEPAGTAPQGPGDTDDSPGEPGGAHGDTARETKPPAVPDDAVGPEDEDVTSEPAPAPPPGCLPEAMPPDAAPEHGDAHDPSVDDYLDQP